MTDTTGLCTCNMLYYHTKKSELCMSSQAEEFRHYPICTSPRTKHSYLYQFYWLFIFMAFNIILKTKVLPMASLLPVAQAFGTASVTKYNRVFYGRRAMSLSISHIVHDCSYRRRRMNALKSLFPFRRVFAGASPAALRGGTVDDSLCASLDCKPKALSPDCRDQAAASSAPVRRNYFDISPQDIRALLTDWGVPAYRESQIRNWVIEKGVSIPRCVIPNILFTKLLLSRYPGYKPRGHERPTRGAANPATELSGLCVDGSRCRAGFPGRNNQEGLPP